MLVDRLRPHLAEVHKALRHDCPTEPRADMLMLLLLQLPLVNRTFSPHPLAPHTRQLQQQQLPPTAATGRPRSAVCPAPPHPSRRVAALQVHCTLVAACWPRWLQIEALHKGLGRHVAALVPVLGQALGLVLALGQALEQHHHQVVAFVLADPTGTCRPHSGVKVPMMVVVVVAAGMSHRATAAMHWQSDGRRTTQVDQLVRGRRLVAQPLTAATARRLRSGTNHRQRSSQTS